MVDRKNRSRWMQAWRDGERLYSGSLQPPLWLQQDAFAGTYAPVAIPGSEAEATGAMPSSHGDHDVHAAADPCSPAAPSVYTSGTADFTVKEPSTCHALVSFRPRTGWNTFRPAAVVDCAAVVKHQKGSHRSYLEALGQFLTRCKLTRRPALTHDLLDLAPLEQLLCLSDAGQNLWKASRTASSVMLLNPPMVLPLRSSPLMTAAAL